MIWVGQAKGQNPKKLKGKEGLGHFHGKTNKKFNKTCFTKRQTSSETMSMEYQMRRLMSLVLILKQQM
ncbi:hypothetical protein [Synechococcus sp. UW140]|uniref:hypothetical protein n=1 Tax=Synechococcus sp. UW140 TaxID=368503 RepID=UPI003137CA8E